LGQQIVPMASADTRGSYSNHSEDFSQTKETAELWDPSDDAFSREGEVLQASLEAVAERLEAARRSRDPEELAGAEAAYERASEAWLEFQATLKEDLLTRPGYLSLSAALRLDLESGEELSSVDEHARRQALEVLIEYVMQSGLANLGGAFKNFLAMVRRVKPEALEGITQTDLALILDEKKATTSSREIERVEKVAKRAGVKGFHFLGGTKPEETRRRSAASARGNTNRRDGTRRKRA
jgi:Xaa-Pro aminopeptidase